MKIVEADGFEFRFEDALDAFVFDETDSTKPTFHGAPMKGVDIVAEFAEAYVYVELKDYDDPSIYNVLGAATEDERNSRQASFKWLKNYLKYKFRDSCLYRHAEQKVDKPVHYVCLITFELSVDLDPQPAADHPEVDRRGLHQGKRRVQKRSYGVVSEGHGVPKRRRNRTKNFRRHAAP